MSSAAKVHLVPVDADNWRDLIDLHVAPEQLRFVAGYAPIALLMMAKAYARPGGQTWDPYAIVNDGQPVGMLQHCYDVAPVSPSWLRHFFIDVGHQGRGLARPALTAFVTLIRDTRPNAREILLTMHPDNTHAQRLYLRFGFEATGDDLDGEPVYRIPLYP